MSLRTEDKFSLFAACCNLVLFMWDNMRVEAHGTICLSFHVGARSALAELA